MKKELHTYNNPVSRLYNLIIQLKSYRPLKNEQRTIANWFIGSLHYDADPIYAHLAIADAVKLVEAAEKVIKNLDDVNKEQYLEPFQHLRRLFRIKDIDSPPGNWLEKINDNIILRLELASNIVSLKEELHDVSQEDLDKLLIDVQDLEEKIIKSTINLDLKSQIIERLETIRLAIIGYSINGIEGLRKAAELNLGFIILNLDKIRSSNKSDSKIWDWFLKLLTSIEKITKIGTSLQTLAGGDINNLLPPIT